MNYLPSRNFHVASWVVIGTNGAVVLFDAWHGLYTNAALQSVILLLATGLVWGVGAVVAKLNAQKEKFEAEGEKCKAELKVHEEMAASLKLQHDALEREIMSGARSTTGVN